jgi:PAS domain S-box-containing protein
MMTETTTTSVVSRQPRTQEAAFRILVVDDDELDRLAVRRCLQRSSVLVGVEEAGTAAEARERIAASAYDCILLDYYIPGVEGLALLRSIRKAAPETPVVIFTGRGDEEIAVELMKAGAADYLPKASLSTERLTASLRFSLELFEARAAQRRAEAALHEQREWLRITLTSIGDGVIATDAAGCVTFLNPVAQNLTGWKSEEAEGQHLTKVFSIIDEQTRAPLDNPGLRAMKEGTIVGLTSHTILIAKDGTERAIDDSGAPIRDAHGKLIGAVLIFRDITEQRRLEREREQQAVAARFLAAVVESSEDAIIRQSLDGDIQSWNAAAERLFGCPAAAMGGSIRAFIPADRVDEEDQMMASIRAGKPVKPFDTIRVRSDGQHFPVNLTVSPIRDEEGRIVGASKIYRDITARKRAEGLLRLLAEAAQHLLTAGNVDELVRGLYEKIKESIGVDAYCSYVVNDTENGLQLESCGGIPEETAASIRRLDFGTAVCGTAAAQRREIHATHIQQSNEPLMQLLKSLGIRAYACHPLIAEYRLLGILSFASRTKDEFTPEELDFLRTVSHYVTVAHERLRHIERLQEGDRRKDQFLATLAHELRNPLAPISNMLELMKRAKGEDGVVEQARDTMERQLGQLVHLVNDLLDMSRISLDKLELRPVDLPLASVVAQAVEAARPQADGVGHRLNVDLPAEPIMLHADPVRLTQVFGNLLTNACKYTDAGGQIRLTAEREGNQVLVRVTDTGIGISAEQLPRVFEIFSQVQSAQERSQGGLGIGLTLVKRLTEMHGGSVEAHSDGAGKGSEFIVRLPIATTQTRKTATAPSGVPATMVGRRILVVDDNQDSAESLARLLRMNGNATTTAFDGASAVDEAEQFRPDVVLMDIGLPRLNGYDACRRIRELPWGGEVLMVAMTGWGQDEDRRKSKDAGFDHHVVKPVDYSVLIRLLAEREAAAVSE